MALYRKAIFVVAPIPAISFPKCIGHDFAVHFLQAKDERRFHTLSLVAHC